MIKTGELIGMYHNLTNARSTIEKELRERLSWQDLNDIGLKVSAIIKYRDESNPRVSLTEAKQAVESHEKRHGVY